MRISRNTQRYQEFKTLLFGFKQTVTFLGTIVKIYFFHSPAKNLTNKGITSTYGHCLKHPELPADSNIPAVVQMILFYHSLAKNLTTELL